MLIQNVTISVYLLCIGRLSLIISDEEDESIIIDWNILAMQSWLLDVGFKTKGIITQYLLKKGSVVLA